MYRGLLAAWVVLLAASCSTRPPYFAEVPYRCSDGGYGRCSMIHGDTLIRY